MQDGSEMDSESNLVYPKIQSIYSSTSVKTEPLDFEDNDFEQTETNDYDSSNDFYMPIPNKIILGSKPPSQPSEATASTSWEEAYQPSEATASTSWEETYQPSEATASTSWGEAYQCDECNMFFPNQNDLDTHKASHSLLVARPASRTSKSTNQASDDSLDSIRRSVRMKVKTSGSPIRKVLLTKKLNSEFLCKHCDVNFPNEIALIKHTYELIPETTFATKSDLKVHGLKAPTFKVQTRLLHCHICSVYLKHLATLKRHLLKQHNTNECVSKYVKFTGKCVHCPCVSTTNREHNKHIVRYHNKIYTKKVKKTIPDVPTETKELQKEAKPIVKKVKFSKHLTADTAPIPNQTLFKCNKCQIHFVTSSTAYEHSKRCVLAKGDWKCNVCRRTFTHTERNIHTKQHKVSDKFKIHVITNTMPSKVLCKCPKCQLHLHEEEFWEHYDDCSSQTGIECSSCKLEFHKNALKKHREGHIKHNYSRPDYIIVDYVESAKTVDKKTQNVLYYCVHCKSHQLICKVGPWHRSGSCRQTIRQRLCNLCGLTFSEKSMLNHIYHHQRKKLTLNDYTFIRIQDNVVTPPLMPDFFKCQKCDVRFGSPSKVITHKCKTVESMYCDKCRVRFETALFKIHQNFHAYDVPAWSSTNFFACVCGCGFHSYDGLINHCQDHFVGVQATKVVYCKCCKLKYSEDHTRHDANFRILKFDHESLLTADWFNGFDSVSKSDANDIVSRSVYSSLRNVRLELLKEGPPERCLYKCVQCDVHVDSETVAKHLTVCAKSKGIFSCDSCSAVFDNSDTLCTHTDIHVIYGDDITFKEISFNDARHKKLNEALQAGKKESLKFRKCSSCDLLVKKDEYERHISEHNEKSKRVFKYGTVKYHHPAGDAKIYKVYKCRKCGSSMKQMKNVPKHKCVFDDSALVECPQCSQRFRASRFSRHAAVHAALPKFVADNITVVEFEIVAETVPKKRRYSDDSDFQLDTDVTPRKRQREVAVKTEVEDEFTEDLMKYDQTPIEVPSMMQKNRLFQCHRCYMCFLHRMSLLAHVLKCTADSVDALTCDSCELTYHPSLESFHKKLHQDVKRKIIENYLHVHNISTKGIRLSDESCWIYQCRSCDVYYMTQKALEMHLYNNHKFYIDCVACELCGKKFTLSSRGKHMKIHHQKNRRVEDLNYQSVVMKIVGGYALDALKPSPLETQARTVEVKKEDIDESDEHTKSFEVSKSKSDENILYKCVVCSIHFINKRTFQCHLNFENHETKSITCAACGLLFSKRTVRKHMAWHHDKLELKRDDFIIQTDTEGTEGTANLDTLDTEMAEDNGNNDNEKSHEEIDTTNNDDIDEDYDRHNLIKAELTDKDSSLTEEATEILPNDVIVKSTPKKIKLYQCKDCRTCVRKTNTLLHECCSDIRKKRCIRCSLSFPRSEFKQHSRLHERFELSRKNFSIIAFGRAACSRRIYKCVRCGCHFATLMSLEWHMGVQDHKTKKVTCQSCGLVFGKSSLNRHTFIHHTKLKLSPHEFDVVNVGVNETVANLRTPESINHVKLFKCSECDVFFLQRGSYYQHLYNHEVLDDTEFIRCKICSLQFLTESLAGHMKSHKDKTFSLDNVVVESYNPSVGELVSKTYMAEETFNSKQVTTTTLFDNVQVNLREEQMSTVDSTIDESKLDQIQV